ncbi:MAG: Fic family protein [Dehalococcoidales bacterium]|nr:Fic family protein [Dehalococcoidales bacterium]
MNITDYRSGVWRKTAGYRYFFPEKINHTFVWTDDGLNELLETASLRLGELNSFSRFVPDLNMFIKMHVLKEAVTSSRIEGTRTNIDEAFNREKDVNPEKRDDWREVNNYVQAMNTAIEELKTLPLSNRLIRNTHKILLASGRGEHKTPGEFRKSQNWIGGVSPADAVFVPPSYTELTELLADLEIFLNNTDLRIPHLVRIAIAHYQFETIHPFLDGNGRIGRLLITLYLVSAGVLEKPLLYLSDYFEKNKTLYYDNLEKVRIKNDMGQWLKFFLTGVIQTAENGVSTLHQITDLKTKIEKDKVLLLGKRAKQGSVLLTALFSQPVVTVKEIQSITGLSPKAANDLVQAFLNAGIVNETTGYQRNRVFVFEDYLKLFR